MVHFAQLVGLSAENKCGSGLVWAQMVWNGAVQFQSYFMDDIDIESTGNPNGFIHFQVTPETCNDDAMVLHCTLCKAKIK